MTTFLSFLTKKKFPSKQAFERMFHGTFSALTATITAVGLVFLAAIYALLLTINNRFLIEVPARGGSLTEGIVGAPRTINPLVAQTQNDMALSTLVYAGLMKESADGTITPDLIKDYTISPAGTEYTFTLLPNLTFSNGKPLTSDDVAFTFDKLKDVTVNQASAGYWQDKMVTTPNATTVVVTLPKADTTFLTHLTVGIVSKAELESIQNEALTDPSQAFSAHGAGPFRLARIAYKNGSPSLFTFKRNKHYAGTAAMLAKIRVMILANQDDLFTAIKKRDIDFTSGIDPSSIDRSKLSKNLTLAVSHTPRTMTLYRLQSEPMLSNASLVTALDQFIDKGAIVATVENGYGVSDTPREGEHNSKDATLSTLRGLGYTTTSSTLTKGATTLTIRVAAENSAEVLATAQELAAQLGTLGITVETRSFDQGTMNDTVASELYPFVLADNDETTLPANYVPAFTLYTKGILYVQNASAHAVNPPFLESPALRYAESTDWYERTDKIWKWLIRKN